MNSSLHAPIMTTQTIFDPLPSIYDSAEEEAEHTAWLRAKLQASIDDPRPSITHEEVERRMTLRLARLYEQHAAKESS